MAVRTFEFNTRVRPSSGAKLCPGQVWRMGLSGEPVKVIPFQCEDVPEGAIFAFAAPSADLYPHAGFIVREILPGSALVSKYAYFRLRAVPAPGGEQGAVTGPFSCFTGTELDE